MYSTQSRFLFALLLASSMSAGSACASPTVDDGDDAQSQGSDVKKKVKPKAGNGAFDLVAPSFAVSGFIGSFTFDGLPIKAGDRVEKVPGTYLLRALPKASGAEGVRTMEQFVSVVIVFALQNL